MNDRTVPRSDELCSIIVPCCNALPYTQQCLESVIVRTRSPYELILVDNGSTDSTYTHLQGVQEQPGPMRVVVLHNDTNRGFPAGCNQGLAHAGGSYVVFLNNDTIVTSDWLECLIEPVIREWPTVGLAGAVSNFAMQSQQVAVDYVNEEGLEDFADRRRKDFHGKLLDVERLSGFCMLARRDVLEQVGGFDEQFGLGFFDDDDLALRARNAGFRTVVALDAFVHHFGNRTFSALGVDCRRQLNENLEKFLVKWGRTSERDRYHLPEKVLVERRVSDRPRVSVCMIVRDEETNLPECLEPLRELVDEFVIVDTGSTDRTKQIANQVGARVFDFKWVDSFAAARNESLRHATGDWILWLDADDRIDVENRTRLVELLRSLRYENAAYVMKCVCVPDQAGAAATAVDHLRLFHNHPDLRWEYRVHEQVLGSVRRLGMDVRWSDVIIQHVGYQDPALRARKLERDLRLLRLEDQDRPDHPFTLFNLGSVYHELSRPAEALALLRRSLDRSHPDDSIVRKLYALIVQCQRELGRAAEALVTCRQALEGYPDDTELLFACALLLRESHDFAGAEACLNRLLQPLDGDHFASVDTGLRGYKARNNLAELCCEQERTADAHTHWQAAVDERPDFVPAWIGLGGLYVEQRRWDDLEQVAGHLEGELGRPVEAAVLRARGHLGRSEFRMAHSRLAETIRRAPTAIWPRAILTHVLLQEGADWQAAERALLNLLDLDPENTEARHNLRVLYAQRQWRG